jgi:hypothetical protein
VAIDETIIKIAGRCIVKISRQKINAKLMSGFQLGDGVPAGLEASTHSVRLILDRNPTFLAPSLDMRNAFNTIRRADIAEQQLVKQGFPELIPYFKMCYDKTSKLHTWRVDGGDCRNSEEFPRNRLKNEFPREISQFPQPRSFEKSQHFPGNI